MSVGQLCFYLPTKFNFPEVSGSVALRFSGLAFFIKRGMGFTRYCGAEVSRDVNDSEVHISCLQDGPGSVPWPGRQRVGFVWLLSVPDSRGFHARSDMPPRRKRAVRCVSLRHTARRMLALWASARTPEGPCSLRPFLPVFFFF